MPLSCQYMPMYRYFGYVRRKVKINFTNTHESVKVSQLKK